MTGCDSRVRRPGATAPGARPAGQQGPGTAGHPTACEPLAKARRGSRALYAALGARCGCLVGSSAVSSMDVTAAGVVGDFPAGVDAAAGARAGVALRAAVFLAGVPVPVPADAVRAGVRAWLVADWDAAGSR